MDKPNKKILLVDDDMCKLSEQLARLMARYSVEVFAVEDFEGAVAMTKTNKFDLILLDFQLKGYKSGLDVLDEIRKTDKDTLICMLSAYSEHEKYAMSLGANKYFHKPFDWKKHILDPLGIKY